MEESQLHSNELLGMETTQSNGQLHSQHSGQRNEGTSSFQTIGTVPGRNGNYMGSSGKRTSTESHDIVSTRQNCSQSTQTIQSQSQSKQYEYEYDNTDLLDAWRTRQEVLSRRKDICTVLLGSLKAFPRFVLYEWNDFFYSRTDARYGGKIRIAYCVLALMNTLHLFMDFELFFIHWIDIPTGIDSWASPNIQTPFAIPSTTEDQEYFLELGAKLWVFQLTLLLLGIAPRFNAIGNFFWHVSFQHHNYILFDGSDNLFRFFAFFLIFCPLHHYTIWDVILMPSSKQQQQQQQQKDSSKKEDTKTETTVTSNTIDTWPMWPFRLIQLEFCFMFFSSCMSKFEGIWWRNGTTMFYIVHLDEFFGKLFAPQLLFGYMNPLKVLTWSTLVIEVISPFTLWMEKYRVTTIYILLVFHFGIDLSMNLEFFHWIMMLGWMTFFVQPIHSEQALQEHQNSHQNQKRKVSKTKERKLESNNPKTESKTNEEKEEGEKKSSSSTDQKASAAEIAEARKKKERRNKLKNKGKKSKVKSQ